LKSVNYAHHEVNYPFTLAMRREDWLSTPRKAPGGLGGLAGPRRIMASSGAEDLAAAKRRFPGRAGKIESLAAKDEAFRDMCEELAVAEQALTRLSAAPAGGLPERRMECEGWITRLGAEMDAALARAEMPAQWRR
jgi:hypothetical protein